MKIQEKWTNLQAFIVTVGVIGFSLLLRVIKRVYSHELQY